MFPPALHLLSIASLALAAACALGLAVDVARRPQPMGVMEVVWPVVALFGSVAVVAFYVRHGRAPARAHAHDGCAAAAHDASLPTAAAKGALHCGAGCMIGDLVAEWLGVAFPGLAAAFGLGTLFDDRLFAMWALDFVLAFGLGIVFQYFAIVPMRHLSPGAGLLAALKADALSLAAWQVGMYGVMALAQFGLFPALAGERARVATPEFWFAMQVAMGGGFLTAWPVNAWLVRAGWKEAM